MSPAGREPGVVMPTKPDSIVGDTKKPVKPAPRLHQGPAPDDELRRLTAATKEMLSPPFTTSAEVKTLKSSSNAGARNSRKRSGSLRLGDENKNPNAKKVDAHLSALGQSGGKKILGERKANVVNM